MSDLQAQAFDVLNDLYNQDVIDYSDYGTLYDALDEIPTLKERDEVIETLWGELENVLFDDDNPEERDMVLMKEWRGFPAGTSREDIWHWFDERHSRGVYYLLYGEDVQRQRANKLMELAEMSIECETEDCAYYRDGLCRFALVNEKPPKITEDDGCVDGIIDVRR